MMQTVVTILLWFSALAAASTESRTGGTLWNDYRRRWTRWNHVRTLACVGASALFILALQLRFA
jgi:uncharacterized membrane protein